jgi:homoserine acetyltransferase
MFKEPNYDCKYVDLKDFAFQNGTRLPHVRLAYKVFNPHATKVALIPTCFRGRIDSTLNFASGALQEYRIIVVALFGNGESSSPSNTVGFPELLDYQDCVRAQYALLTRQLDIRSIDVMLGFSMGGQCTYHWIAMYPDFIRNAVIMCSSARTSLHNYQFLEGPKAALENAVDYAPLNCRPKEMTVARGLNAFGKAYSAWLTSAHWFEQKRFKDLGYETLQDWDKATTSTNYNSWDPDDLLSMLRMWQNGNITKCNSDSKDSLEDSLARVKARVLLMPCRSDQYFHWEASEREVNCLRYGTLEIIPSIWGHLAAAGSNQEDTDWMDQKISTFLKTEA